MWVSPNHFTIYNGVLHCIMIWTASHFGLCRRHSTHVMRCYCWFYTRQFTKIVTCNQYTQRSLQGFFGPDYCTLVLFSLLHFHPASQLREDADKEVVELAESVRATTNPPWAAPVHSRHLRWLKHYPFSVSTQETCILSRKLQHFSEADSATLEPTDSFSSSLPKSIELHAGAPLSRSP